MQQRPLNHSPNAPRRHFVAFAVPTAGGVRLEVHALEEPREPAPTRVIVTQGHELPADDAPSVLRAA